MDAPPRDSDGDGIANRDDRCPTEAETVNGVDDDDGCPEQNPTLTVQVLMDGAPVKSATVTLDGPAPQTLEYQGLPIPLEVPPQSIWKAQATSGACASGEKIVQLDMDDDALDVEIAFVPAALLRFVVTDADGEPVPDVQVALEADDPLCLTTSELTLADGTGVQDVGATTYRLTIDALGHQVEERTVTAELGQEVLVEVQLR